MFKPLTPTNHMKHINILKLTLSSVFLLGVNSAVAQLVIGTGTDTYQNVVQDTVWAPQVDFSDAFSGGVIPYLHIFYDVPPMMGPSSDPLLDLAPAALLYGSDELYSAAGNVNFNSDFPPGAYTPDQRVGAGFTDASNVEVMTIGASSPEGDPAAEIVSIEAPTLINNILSAEAITSDFIVGAEMLIFGARVEELDANIIETSRLTLVSGNGGSSVNLEASGMSGLITREVDGLIHLGTNSFIFDDVSTDHVLTTDSGTEIILGGDIASTTGVDESKNIRVANDLNVDGDVFIDGNLGVQAQLDILNQSSSGNFANAIASNSTAIASNKRSIEQNARGIAMVAALQHTTVLPGMSQALDVSAAHFEGETGMSINYARRINENVQINFGAASTDDFDESVIKAGIGFQW